MKVALHALVAALLLVPGTIAFGPDLVPQETGSRSMTASGGPLDNGVTPWSSMEQTLSGDAGDWVVVYQPLATGQTGDTMYALDYAFEAADPDGGPVATFVHPPRLVAQTKGMPLALESGHLHIEEDGEYHAATDPFTFTVHGFRWDVRTQDAGLLFIFAASAPWTVTYDLDIFTQGEERTTADHEATGSGMAWSRHAPGLDVDPLGTTYTYTAETTSAAGWNHVQLREPNDHRFGTGEDPTGAQVYRIDFGSRGCEGFGASTPAVPDAAPPPYAGFSTWLGRIDHCGYPHDDGGPVSVSATYDEPRPGLEVVFAHFPGLTEGMPPLADREYPRDFPVGTALGVARRVVG